MNRIKKTVQFHCNKITNTNRTAIAISILVVLCIAPSISVAADFAGNLKKVSITDQEGRNSPPTAEIKYTQSGNTVNFDASEAADLEGNIREYKWDFGDGFSATGINPSHQYVQGNFTVTLTVSDNEGGISITQRAIDNAPFQIAVNFQPSTSPVPVGFVGDYGEAYSSIKGFGWTVLPKSVNKRNYSTSPSEIYDTLALANPTSVWEVAVPKSGNYAITICLGDPYYQAYLQNVQIEGVNVANETFTVDSRWIEKKATVNVVDGKLTIKFVDSQWYGKLCWLKIISQ